jgi:hypothetical protein
VATDPAAIRPATLVDSCVLLDVITGDEQWADWSAGEIAVALDAGRVVINPLIYTEVSVGYETVEELEELLPASDYEREPLPYLAGFAAGKAFVRYRRVGGGQAIADAGLLHRRACRHCGLPATDARCQPVPDVFSDRRHHRAGSIRR